MGSQSTKGLAERDAAIIWHPYTQHKTSGTALPIVKSEGVYLVDEKGKKYIDAISSWWTNLHGHAHPYIAQKIYEQAQQLEHVIFAGCTHEPAVQLGERLLPLLPGNFSKIFYSDNGSTAVEVALKMALQYQRNKEQGTRNKVLVLRHSYHGDTFGAMSVSERSVFVKAFEDYLFEVIFVDLNSSFTTQQLPFAETACFIYEPLLQGAGGMNIYEAEKLSDFLKLCKKNNIICIADEVMTGFYRTGKMFASEYADEKPDIICLSKGLTGGSLPLAITACSQKIFDAFLSDDMNKTLFHGHSYTANPIACAAALASLDLLQKKECIENIEFISTSNKQFVKQIQQNEKVLQPRSIGTVLAFELNSQQNEYLDKIKERVIELSLQEGVLLRPLGNTVYIMPPYCISAEQLKKVYKTLQIIINKI